MPQLFRPSINNIFRYTVVALAIATISFFGVLEFATRSSFATGLDESVEQPIPFSHKHHVKGLGLDCRYCHENVARGASAGLPSLEICMNCHDHIWKDAEVLAPLRAHFAQHAPLAWNQVHRLPDYVYFNHSVHLAKGVRCLTCHGNVPEMALMRPVRRWEMKECLECHRNPEKFLRPIEEAYSFEPNKLAPAAQVAAGIKLLEDYQIEGHRLVNCSVCHR